MRVEICTHVIIAVSDFEDCADQIKKTGKNQKRALTIVDEQLGVTREELRGMLRAEGLSQQRAHRTVEDLIDKGALTQDGEMLYTSDSVTQALHSSS
jgi:predicted HTH transcriptional regulator